MDDLSFRRRAVIDPSQLREELSADISEKDISEENRKFLQDQLQFEQQLDEALQTPVSENLADKIILAQAGQGNKPSYKSFRVAWVASIGAIMLAAIILFNLNASENTNNHLLKTAVLNHIYEDSHALDTLQEYSKVHVNSMLASMGGKLSDPIGNISYLGRCIVGKKMGLHMVVRTESELITVLILPYERISKPLTVSDNNYSGVIVPTSKGGIVIIGDKDEPNENSSNSVKAQRIIRERVEKNLHWII